MLLIILVGKRIQWYYRQGNSTLHKDSVLALKKPRLDPASMARAFADGMDLARRSNT